MALQILRNVAQNIHGSPFITDEMIYMSNREQFVICLQLVDDNLLPNEDVIGFHKVDCINDATIESVVVLLRDVLVSMNLSIQKCRGQCYDLCSTMVEFKCGVNCAPES